MDLKEAVATNIRRARHRLEMTQEDLAEKAGLTSRYVGSIERAKVSVTVTVLGRLAGALKLDPCDLLRRSPGGGAQRPHQLS